MGQTKQIMTAAEVEDFLPIILKEKKTTLEKEGWTFELNEKEQWAAFNGVSRWEWYNNLDKVFRMIEKDKLKTPEKGDGLITIQSFKPGDYLQTENGEVFLVEDKKDPFGRIKTLNIFTNKTHHFHHTNDVAYRISKEDALAFQEAEVSKIDLFPSQNRIVEWDYLQTIAETNSCGTIFDKGTIKKPFEFEGGLYIATGSVSSRITSYKEAEAYRVLTEDKFKEILVSVEKKPGTGYHGEKVKYKKDEYILALPKIKFVLSFDFDVLTDSGWEFGQHDDGSWFANKTFEGESLPTQLWSIKTPESLFNRCREEDRHQAALRGEQVFGEEINFLDPPVESDTDENGFIESGEQRAAEAKTSLPMFAVESCCFELSDEEILKRTYSMRHAQAELRAEEVRHAREKDIYKSNKKMIEARVESLGQRIDTKSEYRELECPLEYDFQKGSVIPRRPDTGEVISRRGMTKEERQKRLF